MLSPSGAVTELDPEHFTSLLRGRRRSRCVRSCNMYDQDEWSVCVCVFIGERVTLPELQIHGACVFVCTCHLRTSSLIKRQQHLCRCVQLPYRERTHTHFSSSPICTHAHLLTLKQQLKPRAHHHLNPCLAQFLQQLQLMCRTRIKHTHELPSRGCAPQTNSLTETERNRFAF